MRSIEVDSLDRRDGAAVAERGRRTAPWRNALTLGRGDLAVAAGAVALTLVLMGPVLWNLNTRLYGIGRDGVAAAYVIAQRLQATGRYGPFGPRPSLLGAPFPYVDPGASADPLWWGAGVALANVLGPVGATNVLIMVGLSGTAIAAFAFLRISDLPLAPAAVGALIYGFCPIRLAEAQEHFLLLDDFWLVGEAGILLALLRTGRLRWAIALGGCIAVAELDSPYLGYFAGIFAGTWFTIRIIWLVAHRDWREAGPTALQGGVALLVLVLVLVPTQASAIYATTQGSTSSAGSVSHTLGDVDQLSLRWWNFLLPFPFNPVFGPLGRGVFFAKLGGADAVEETTMPGYIALLLATSGLAATARLRLGGFRRTGTPDGVSGPSNAILPLALVCIFAGVFFGLPSQIRLGGAAVPTPSYLMHALLPEFRTIARIDLLIQLGVAMLAAIGVHHLLGIISAPVWGRVVCGALAMLILLEYTDVPPWRSVALEPAPALDRWLATLTDQQAGIVIQYPTTPASLASTAVKAFYAYQLHHHRLFDGVLDHTPADALRRNLEDILAPTTPGALAALGIRTVTVDNSYYRPFYGNVGLPWAGDAGFSTQLPPGLLLRYRDETSAAYAVTTAPSPLLAGIGDGFGDDELGTDGRLWHWLNAEATLWVDNVTDRPVSAVLWTMAHNNASGHIIAWSGYTAAPVAQDRQESPVAIAVEAEPGVHPVSLRVGGGATRLAGSTNPSLVSAQLRSIEPAPIRPLDATFSQGGRGRWTLVGASIDACIIQAGDTLDIALLWRVVAPTKGDQTVFLHVVASDGTLVAQSDAPPEAGTVGTSRATPGSRIADAHSIGLADSLAPGSYQLLAGLYDSRTGTRLPLVGGGDTVQVGSVTVAPPTSGPKRIACPWQ